MKIGDIIIGVFVGNLLTAAVVGIIWGIAISNSQAVSPEQQAETQQRLLENGRKLENELRQLQQDQASNR